MGKHLPTNILASYLVPMRDGKVLLARRKNTGYYDGYYGLVSGHVEAGENFTQALIREVSEESGIALNLDMVKIAHILHRKAEDGSERVEAFYTLEYGEGEVVNREPEKCDDLSWFSWETLPSNTIPYITKVLGNIQRGVSYSEFGW